MKTKLLVLISLLISSYFEAQVIIPYPQQIANYDAFFTDGGGYFDNAGPVGLEFAMWAKGSGAKQSVAWRNFTEDGTTSGNAYTLGVGDSFTITVAATQAYGQIGISLLASPTGTSSWADRQNNYAVQVNLNGNGGAYDPWDVVSVGGTVNSSSIGGSSSSSIADFKFTFTLNTANTMTVVINDDIANTFNVTLNNQNITAYSVYIADDWNGLANSDIYWKQTSQLSSIILATEDFQESSINIFSFEDSIHIKGLYANDNYSLSIFDTMGRQVKTITSNADVIDISDLQSSLYFVVLETAEGNTIKKKIVKQ